MSTFITTGINIDTKAGKVWLSGYSSNEYPKKSSRFESTYLSDMLTAQGVQAVEAYLLEQYAGGMIRGGNNDYANAGKVFGQFTLENLEKLRALKKETRGKKYIIEAPQGYLVRVTARSARVSHNRDNALKLGYIDAVRKANRFNDTKILEA